MLMPAAAQMSNDPGRANVASLTVKSLLNLLTTERLAEAKREFNKGWYLLTIDNRDPQFLHCRTHKPPVDTEDATSQADPPVPGATSSMSLNSGATSSMSLREVLTQDFDLLVKIYLCGGSGLGDWAQSMDNLLAELGYDCCDPNLSSKEFADLKTNHPEEVRGLVNSVCERVDLWWDIKHAKKLGVINWVKLNKVKEFSLDPLCRPYDPGSLCYFPIDNSGRARDSDDEFDE